MSRFGRAACLDCRSPRTRRTRARPCRPRESSLHTWVVDQDEWVVIHFHGCHYVKESRHIATVCRPVFASPLSVSRPDCAHLSPRKWQFLFSDAHFRDDIITASSLMTNQTSTRASLMSNEKYMLVGRWRFTIAKRHDCDVTNIRVLTRVNKRRKNKLANYHCYNHYCHFVIIMF